MQFHGRTFKDVTFQNGNDQVAAHVIKVTSILVRTKKYIVHEAYTFTVAGRLFLQPPLFFHSILLMHKKYKQQWIFFSLVLKSVEYNKSSYTFQMLM